MVKPQKKRKPGKIQSDDEIWKNLSPNIIKHLTKAMKISKTFYLLKCNRKINSLKADIDGSSKDTSVLDKEVLKLKELKSIEYSKLASFLFYSTIASLFLGSDRSMPSMTPSELEWYNIISKHNRIKEEVKAMEEKVKIAMEENNRLKDEMQSKRNKTAQKEALRSKMEIGRTATKRAVFVDSLQDNNLSSDEKDDLNSEDSETIKCGKKTSEKNSEKKHMKSLRNQRNRVVNKLKREGKIQSSDPSSVDLSIYMPVDQRGIPLRQRATTKRRNKISDKLLAHKSSTRSLNKPSHSMPIGPKMNNDDSANNNNLKQLVTKGKDWKDSGVHPSWAAKQLAKKTAITIPSSIMPNPGQKIKFED